MSKHFRVGRRRIVGLLASLVLLGAGTFQLYRMYTAPDAAILIDSATARWIKADDPIDLRPRRVERKETAFHRAFDLSTPSASVTLRVRSFRDCRVFANGAPIEPEARGAPRWVVGDLYQVAGALREGRNDIVIIVENDHGPPALLVESGLPELRSGLAWQVDPEPGQSARVRLLADGLSHPIQQAFPSAGDGLRTVAPYLAGAFLLGFAAAFSHSEKGRLKPEFRLTPSRARWLLICAWSVVCANHLLRLDPYVGFDVQDHLHYIGFILLRGRLPLATDGWQTFQSPLYYLLTAALLRIASVFVPAPPALHVARLLPMLSGLALIEISYCAAVRVFANQPDLQMVATVVAGTVPMSFYSCQEIGNEPVAGAVGAGLLYLCLREVTASDRPSRRWKGVPLGALFGVALLAKVSALVLTPVVAGVLWYRFRGRGVRPVVSAGLGFLTAAALVSGWYFARNWLRLGRPFIGGWDATRGINWWQDPGYRTLPDLFRFGEALVRPMYSALAGFWDGLYATFWLDSYASSIIVRSVRPPWDYDFMVSLAPMALPLSFAVLAGIILIPATREPAVRAALAVSAAAGLCFLAAVAYLYLTVPIYSTVKATYALSMVPAVGLLAARGLQGIVERRWGRAILSGYLASWVLCVFAAFLIH